MPIAALQVPGYFAAQILGAFTAACIIYGVYYDVLSAVPGSFAGVLITGPASLVPTLSATFFSVFIGAALLSECDVKLLISMTTE